MRRREGHGAKPTTHEENVVYLILTEHAAEKKLFESLFPDTAVCFNRAAGRLKILILVNLEINRQKHTNVEPSKCVCSQR